MRAQENQIQAGADRAGNNRLSAAEQVKAAPRPALPDPIEQMYEAMMVDAAFSRFSIASTHKHSAP